MEHQKAQKAAYQILVYKGSELPKQYEAMVFSKWLRSLRYGNDYFKLIEQDSYYHHYHTYIGTLLKSPACHIRLATLVDDADCVLGWSASRGSILDYIHVHKDYRRHGIGGSLIPKDVDIITHITRQGMSFWNNKLPKAQFDPFK